MELVKDYFFTGKQSLFIEKTSKMLLEKGFSDKVLKRQIDYKLDILSKIESFILVYMDTEENLDDLVLKTLAYSLANKDQKKELKQLFSSVLENISNKQLTPEVKKVYGKTLYGIYDAIKIQNFIEEHLEIILISSNHEEMLSAIYPILIQNIEPKKFKSPKFLKALILGWINGLSYIDILNEINRLRVKEEISDGIKINDVIDVCNSLDFRGSLFIGSVIEILNHKNETDEEPRLGGQLKEFKKLQKRFRYGLPNKACVSIYELGFCDRMLAQEILKKLGKAEVVSKQFLKNNKNILKTIIQKYPSYFEKCLKTILE